MRRRDLLLTLALFTSLSAAQPRHELGRCPLENVVRIRSLHCRAPGTTDLLVTQDLGRLELVLPDSAGRAQLRLQRLALLSFNGERFAVTWQGEPSVGSAPAGTGILASAWAAGDVDADSLDELLLFSADSCRILHFTPDSWTTDVAAVPGARPTQAVCADLDLDGWDEVATLEERGDSYAPAACVYQPVLPEFRLRSEPLPLPVPDSGVSFSFTGAARLEDYDGELPVLAGQYPSLRPSRYSVLYASSTDTFRLTPNPFPYQQWFAKNRVLPSGELTLFNVGDTVVAWGYFVPGSRPSGPERSFAALQDGEWRLLQLLPSAARISGPLCRFRVGTVDGWLELRDNILRFYPGDIFLWR